MNTLRLVLCMGVFSFSAIAVAQEARVQLQSTITGSRESPRVIYIVPWRTPDAAQLEWEPEQGIAESLFQPLRRDEYLRQLRFQQQLQAQGAIALPPETELKE